MKRSDRDPLLIAAGAIRERGLAPPRDLWPGITEAIDRQERLTPARHRLDAFSGWARLAAAAAVLVFLVAVPVIQRPLQEAVSRPAEQGLAVIDKALAEINQALATDPDNGGLTRLVLHLQQSRADLMRKNVEDRVRPL